MSHLEATMHQNHHITAQLVDLHRQDLVADAARLRRVPRHRDRTRRLFGRS